MIHAFRKTIGRVVGLLLFLLSFGLARINWRGTNSELDDDGHFGCDISERYKN